jgi:hypothetical protein
MPISRALIYIPLGVPNEQGLLIKIKTHLSLLVPGKGAPPPCSPDGASIERCPFPEPSFTYLFAQREEKASF